jgi:hypothetical protein
MVDVVKLIRAVKCRDPLWDRKHAYYHDRAVTMGLWEEVAILLGVDCELDNLKKRTLDSVPRYPSPFLSLHSDLPYQRRITPKR